MTIKYSKSTDEKKLEIKITGDCDLYSSRELYSGVEKILLTGCEKAVLDMNGVAYLDSSGVGSIIKIIKLTREKHIILRFRGIQKTPRKVLEMSNILSLITEEH